MTPRGALAVAVIGLAALLAGPAARSARADAAADTRAKAAAHFKQGQAFFQHADYDRALAEYQAAYELSAEPLLVFNIALCHDRAQRPEPALQAFQRYLELAPNGAVADEARDDVARLAPIVDRLAAERAAEAARRTPPAVIAPIPPPPVPPPAPSRIPRYVMLAGAGVVAIGVTAHALAWRTRGQLSSAPDPDAYYTDLDSFRLERGVAIGAYAVGALTLATGLVLDRVLRPRAGLEVSVGVVPGGAAIAVGWAR